MINKTYISSVQTRAPKNLITGRLVNTVFDQIGAVQFNAEWLDPAITHGCLLIEVSDVRLTQRMTPRDMMADSLLMSLTAVRDRIIAKIGAGEIPTNQIEWCFDRETEEFIRENYRFQYNTDGRLDDDIRVAFTAKIYVDHETAPGRYAVLDMVPLSTM